MAAKKKAKKVSKVKKATKKAAHKAVKKAPKPAKKTAVKNKTVVTKKAVTKKTLTNKTPAKKKVMTKKKTATKKPVAAKSKPVVKKQDTAKKVIAKKATKAAPKKPAAKRAATRKSASKKAAKAMFAETSEKPVLEKIITEMPTPVSAVDVGEVAEVEPITIEGSKEYMDEVQRAHFRKILSAWKEQIMTEVDSTVIHMKEEAAAYPDPLDRAAQEEGFSLELRTRDRERKLLKKIEQSLDALESGDYGYCEDCGADIGVNRLEARPTAEKCIDCKTFQEIREKQIGG